MADALKSESLPSIVHAFTEHPWGKDLCDAKVDDSGQVRTCARPRALHLTPAELEAELQRLRKLIDNLHNETLGGMNAAIATAADTYLFAHAVLGAVGTGPERPEAARRVADAWLALTTAVHVRRTATNHEEH